MDVTQLNTLIIKKDINNRLHKGMRCYKEGLVLDVKSMADREYGSLDIYGKIMSESDISVYNTNLSFDIKKGDLIYTDVIVGILKITVILTLHIYVNILLLHFINLLKL